MARIVKGGRTQYAQGTSRFEAFRPERREYKRVKRRSNTEELLRLFALAEKIGNSPVGGAAIAGLQKLASNVQGTDKPTLKAAAAARAQAKAEVEGKPIPTPEEQGRAAGEAQADQFIQEAMKQPAPAIAELTPARMTVKRAPPPPPPVDEVAEAEKRREAQRVAEREALRRRGDELTSQMAAKRQLLERMEQVQPKFKLRLRRAIQAGPEEVSKLLREIRQRHASLPSGVTPAEEEYYDVLADYLRIMKDVDVPDIDAAVAKVASKAVVPEPQVRAEREQVVRLRAEADARQKELDENRNLMNEAGIQKNEQDIQNLREQAQDLENKMARRGLSEMDALAQMDENLLQRDERRQAEARRIGTMELPGGTVTVPDRRAEGERSREMATRAMEAAPAEPAQPEVMRDPARRSGIPLSRADVDDIVNKAMAPAPAEQPAEPAPEFMERARAGEKSLQTQREEASQAARQVADGVQKVVGPIAQPEQVKTLTELYARARTATTGEQQADLIRQVENMNLPPRSIFDAMFGGPQQRAAAQLLKFFPKAQRPVRQRTASQQEADRALAEMRRAQARRAKVQAETGIPAQAEARKAQAAVSREKAEAREQGKSLTQARIINLMKKRMRAARRGRDPAPQVRAVATQERKEAATQYKNETQADEAEIKKLRQERTTLNNKQFGNVPAPTKPEDPGNKARRGKKEAYRKAKAAYTKSLAKYEKDQNDARAKKKRLGQIETKLQKLQENRLAAQKRRDARIKAVNDEEAKLLGGRTAEMRRGAKRRAKLQKAPKVPKTTPKTDATRKEFEEE